MPQKEEGVEAQIKKKNFSSSLPAIQPGEEQAKEELGDQDRSLLQLPPYTGKSLQDLYFLIQTLSHKL